MKTLTKVILPDLGEGIESATISEVSVSKGQEINKDNIILVLESDKASMEIPSEVSGTIKSIDIKKGQVYNKKMLESRLFMNQSGRDVSSLYLDDGYLFFQITPVEVKIENDSIDFELRIYEGKQARINRITIIRTSRRN